MREAEKCGIVKFPEGGRGCVLSSLFISLHSFEMVCVCVCVYVSPGLCVYVHAGICKPPASECVYVCVCVSECV